MIIFICRWSYTSRQPWAKQDRQCGRSKTEGNGYGLDQTVIWLRSDGPLSSLKFNPLSPIFTRSDRTVQPSSPAWTLDRPLLTWPKNRTHLVTPFECALYFPDHISFFGAPAHKVSGPFGIFFEQSLLVFVVIRNRFEEVLLLQFFLKLFDAYSARFEVRVLSVSI